MVVLGDRDNGGSNPAWPQCGSDRERTRHEGAGQDLAMRSLAGMSERDRLTHFLARVAVVRLRHFLVEFLREHPVHQEPICVYPCFADC